MSMGEHKSGVPVFVGSTFEDMRAYRRAVESALFHLGTDIRTMEHFGSKSGTPIEECLEVIRSCQIYIGIFGMRYGSVPKGYEMSMIHLEYEEAQRCQLTSLIYILDENAQPILPKDVETGPGAESLRSLKEHLRKEHLVTTFTTPYNLAARILHDVPEAIKRRSIVQAGLPGKEDGDTVPDQPATPGQPHTHAAPAHSTDTPTDPQETRAAAPEPAPSAAASRPAPKDERVISGIHEGVGRRGYHLVYKFADIASLSANAQAAVIEKYLNVIPQVVAELEIEHQIIPIDFEVDPREDGGVVSFFGNGSHVFPYLLMKRLLELQEMGAAQIRIRIGLHNGTVKLIQSPTGASSFTGPGLIVAGRVAESADPGGAAASAAYLEAIADDLPEVKQFLARKSKLTLEGGHDIEYCKFNPSEAESHPADERPGFFDRVFNLRGRGTTVGRELIGGLSTFLVMSYIIFVQPTIIGSPDLPHARVVVATCLASALGCFLMGFLGRYPIATAPGMGQNVFFASLVLLHQFDSGSALGVVFLAGCVVGVVAAVTRIREVVLAAFPRPLRAGIVAGIGLLITLVGLQFAGVVVPEVSMKPPYLHMGELRNAYVLVALGAVCVGLILHARGIRYALIASILIGGIGVTVVSTVVTGTVPSLPPTEWPTGGLFAVSFDRLLANPVHTVQAVFILALISLFDSVGSLLGVGAQAGLVQEGNLPRSRGALLSVAAGSIAGASMGTTTIVPYVESAAGVEAGARTGLATVVTGLLFLAALLVTPLVHAFGGGVSIPVRPGGLIDKLTIYPAIAPAVIIVGSLMLRDVRTIPWDDATEALPAFLTMVVMAFTVNITHGITFGVISYVLLKVCTGRRKEVQWPLYVCAITFFVFYVLGG
jgi:adenine/guanine/hypoxanthine permease